MRSDQPRTRPLANGDLERLEAIASLINYRQPVEMSDPRFVEEMEAKRRVATAVGASIFGSETKVKKESPSLDEDRAFCALVLRNADDSRHSALKQHLHRQGASIVLSGGKNSDAYPNSVTDLLHLMATFTHDTSIGTRGSGEDMIPFNFIVPLPLTPH